MLKIYLFCQIIMLCLCSLLEMDKKNTDMPCSWTSWYLVPISWPGRKSVAPVINYYIVSFLFRSSWCARALCWRGCRRRGNYIHHIHLAGGLSRTSHFLEEWLCGVLLKVLIMLKIYLFCQIIMLCLCSLLERDKKIWICLAAEPHGISSP